MMMQQRRPFQTAHDAHSPTRSSKRPLVEDCLHVRIDSLPKEDIAIVARSAETPWVQLCVQHRDGSGERCRQRMQLVASHPHFGGVRWWFVCPQTGVRCRVLYLQKGRDQFLSRSALNASYESQRKQKIDRTLARARRLRDRLGGEASLLAPTPSKPKWMRWKTYRKVVDRLLEAEATAFRGLDEYYR
jgi:hypothetical protein